MSAFSTLSVRTGPSDYFINDRESINIQLKVGNEHKFIIKDTPNYNEVSTLSPGNSPKYSRTKINYWTPYVRLPCQQNLTWKNSNKFRGLWGTIIKRVQFQRPIALRFEEKVPQEISVSAPTGTNTESYEISFTSPLPQTQKYKPYESKFQPFSIGFEVNMTIWFQDQTGIREPLVINHYLKSQDGGSSKFLNI